MSGWRFSEIRSETSWRLRAMWPRSNRSRNQLQHHVEEMHCETVKTIYATLSSSRWPVAHVLVPTVHPSRTGSETVLITYHVVPGKEQELTKLLAKAWDVYRQEELVFRRATRCRARFWNRGTAANCRNLHVDQPIIS